MHKLLVGLAVVCLPAVAFAGEKKAEIEHYDFPDADKLVTQNLGSSEGKIGARGPAVRTILVRPRVQFVVELLKTIENL
jgi:hypothetical protein